MIHDPILAPIRTLCEARMSDSIRLLQRVLVKHTPLVVFTPVLRVHGVLADEFELAETVVPVIGSSRAVDEEVLPRFGIDELFGSFVGAETDVKGAAVGCLFPGVRGRADDGAFAEV